MTIKQGLVAVALTPEKGVEDGQCAVAPNGTVWQHRRGLWHVHPWWQGMSAEELVELCAEPEGWAYDMGWTREQLEGAVGALTHITLPAPASGAAGPGEGDDE